MDNQEAHGSNRPAASSMFRLLFVALAVGLAGSQTRERDAYHPNSEYAYDYDTQVVTGIPGGSKIYSGMRIKAIVRIQFETASDVLFKMEHVRVFKINDLIDGANPTTQHLPDNLFTEVSGPEITAMRTTLGKPLKFRYIRGHVTGLESEHDDPYWSINAKRGVLTIMEVNMNPEMQSKRGGDRPPNQREEFYTVLEPSVTGECETLYERTPETTQAGDPMIHVLKVRDYTKCINRPEFSNDIFNGVFCADCGTNKTQALTSISRIRYNMKGSNRQFMIQSAVAESEHVFTPYSYEGGNVATFIHQTFELVDSKSSNDRRIPQPSNAIRHACSLRATLPSKVMSPGQGQPSEKMHTPINCDPQQCSNPQHCQPAFQERIKTKITKLLFALSALSNVSIEEEAGRVTIQLTEELRQASYKVIADIWKLYSDRNIRDESMRRRRKILLDLIPATGTYVATVVMEGAIEANQVTPEEASNVLMVLGIHAIPDVCVEKRMKVILKLPMVRQQTHPLLKNTAWLCYGAIVDAIMKRHITLTTKLRKQLSIAERINMDSLQTTDTTTVLKAIMKQSSSIVSQVEEDFKQMLRELLSSEVPNDKLLALKTVGNTGIHGLLPDIRQIIYDKGHPSLLRSHAIFCLRKMAQMTKKPIYETLLPIYFDTNEPEEIRIPAFFMAALSRPPLPVFEMLAESLTRETNPHVGTFVYSFFEEMSNSTHPCLTAFAKNATFALMRARRFDPKYHYSRFKHMSYYSDPARTGSSLTVATISSSKEFVPRAGAVSIDFHMLGANVDNMEFGFNTEGIQKLISKFIGPDGELTNGKSPADLLRPSGAEEEPSTKQPSRNEQVEDIHQQLNVSTRETADPDGNIYFRLYGNEVWFMPLNKQYLKKILEQGKVDIIYNERELKTGVQIKFHRSLVMGHAEHYFATEAGLPMYLKLLSCTIMKVDGTMRMIGEPGLFLRNRKGHESSLIKTEFELHPSALIAVEGKMEIDAFYYKNGAKFVGKLYGNSPVAFSYGYDVRKMKHLASLDVTRLREKLMKFEMTPMTYVEREPLNIQQWPIPLDVKKITSSEQAIVKTISTSWGKYDFGVIFAVKGQTVSRNFLRDVPYCPLSGRQIMYFMVSPGINPPKQLDFEFMMLQNTTQPDQTPESSEAGMFDRAVSALGMILSPFQSSESKQETSMSEMSALIEKLRTSTRIVDHARKSGFVLRYIGMGSQPERALELNALMQTIGASNERTISFKITRSPIPKKEQEPWECHINIDLTAPVRTISPAQLLDSKYQRKVQEQIDMHVRQHGKHHFQMCLSEHLAEQEQKMGKLKSIATTTNLLKEVVRTIINRSEVSGDTALQDLMNTVRTQRQVLSNANVLRMQLVQKRSLPRKRQLLQALVERTEGITEKLRQKLSSDALKMESPEKAILIKYCIWKQHQIMQQLQRMVRSLYGTSSMEIRSTLQEKIDQQKRSVTELQKIQAESMPEHSASVDQESGHSELTRQVTELDRMQKQALLLLSKPQQPIPESGQNSPIEATVRKATEVENALYQILQQSPVIHANLEAKLIEIAIQHQQIIENVKQRLQEAAEMNQIQSPPLQTIVRQKQRMEVQWNKYARLIAKIISIRQARESMSAWLPAPQMELATKLQKIDVQQAIVMNKILSSHQDSVSSQQPEIRAEPLEQAWAKLKFLHGEINGMTQSGTKMSPLLLMKWASVAQMQAKLLKEIQDKASKKYVAEAVKNSEVSSKWKEIKNNAEGLLIGQVAKLEEITNAPRTWMNTVHIPRQSSESAESSSESRQSNQSSSESGNSRESLEVGASQPQESLKMKMKIMFGGLSETKKVIMFELIGKKTLEQLLWQKDQASPIWRDQSMKLYLDQKDGSEEIKRSYNYLTKELNIFRHFHAFATFKKTEIPVYLRRAIWTYMESMKFYMYDHMIEEFPDRNWKPGTIEIYLDVKKNDRQMDMAVKTEYEVNRFHGMYLPMPIRSFVGVLANVRDPLMSKLHPDLFRVGRKLPSICELQRRTIRTFDDKEYRIPNTEGCDAVLAMDCTDSASFAVKAAEKNQTETDKMVVTALIEDKKLEVYPESDALIVKVNSEVRELEDNTPLVIKRSEPNSDRQTPRHIAEIRKTGQTVTIFAKNRGVMVQTNGIKVAVKTSPFYYSKLCGLCGNYDGIAHNDITDPQKRPGESDALPDMNRLVSRYVMSNDRCNADTVKQRYDQPKLEGTADGAMSESPRAVKHRPAPDCRPTPVTKRVMRTVKGRRQICFTTKPVMMCKVGCKPVRPREHRFQLTCMNSSDKATEELRVQSMKRPLHLPKGKVDIVRNYPEPERCTP